LSAIVFGYISEKEGVERGGMYRAGGWGMRTEKGEEERDERRLLK